jgi:hypothetical protein
LRELRCFATGRSSHSQMIGHLGLRGGAPAAPWRVGLSGPFSA